MDTPENRAVFDKKNAERLNGEHFSSTQTSSIGLHFVKAAEPSKSNFESAAHYKYLYDGDTKISRVGEASISPSKKFAAFEDNGKIMLYNSSNQKLTNVTDGKFAIPNEFRWDEEKAQLIITYYNDNPNPTYNNHPDSKIALH